MEATQDSTAAPALPLGDRRPKFAAEAGCEIRAIANLLQRNRHSADPDLIRLEDLSGMVLSCLTDDGATEDYVAELLFDANDGGPPARDERQ